MTTRIFIHTRINYLLCAGKEKNKNDCVYNYWKQKSTINCSRQFNTTIKKRLISRGYYIGFDLPSERGNRGN